MKGRPDSSVEVVPYSAAWPESFERERAAILGAAGAVVSAIEHIGSTAVRGLSAKPTIDILVVIDSIDDFLQHIPALDAIGYDYRSNNTFVGNDNHLFLRKVVDGKRTHHLHVLRSGSPEIDDYRLFRDALRVDRDLASRYEKLKIELALKHAQDRMRYVTEKADWVGDVLVALRRDGKG